MKGKDATVHKYEDRGNSVRRHISGRSEVWEKKVNDFQRVSKSHGSAC